MPKFSDVLDAAQGLSVDEQEALLEILRRRIAECRRTQLVCEVKEARSEFSAGAAQPATAAQIMDEASLET